jgi:hypothetical protein
VARVVGVAGADRHDFRALPCDVAVAVAQLRGVLAAQQSAEVAQEDQHDRTLSPVVAEAVG